MIIAFCLITLALLMGAYMYTRYMANPMVICGIVWFLFYLVLVLAVDRERTEDIYYGAFCLAYFVFILGYCFCDTCMHIRKKTISWKYNYTYNSQTKRIFLLIEYAFMTLLVVEIARTSVVSTSLWTRVRRAERLAYLSEGIFGIAQMFIQLIFFLFWVICLMDGSKENKRNFGLSVIPLLPVMLFMSRGGWFWIIITLFFSYIYVKKISNKRIVQIGVLTFAVFIVIFIISSLDKYSNASLWLTPAEKLKRLFKAYFVNSGLAFVDWMRSEKEMLYGQNTFRLFFAIAARIFPNIEVVSSLHEFVETDGISGNVYTVLRWYAEDFGIAWAMLIQFMFGMLYSYLYNMVKKSQGRSKIFYIVMTSMLMQPLIGQFFDDMYFSVTSLWIKRTILIYILTRNYFVSQKIGGIEFMHEH